MAKRCELTGVGIMAGHNPIPKSKTKTKRDFLPNLKEISLRSDTLGVNLTLKIAAKVLRTINKYGGFDSFIINYGCNKLTDGALKIRKQVEKSLVTSGKYDEVRVIKKAKHRVVKA